MITERLAWTLAHSLWQDVLVAAAALVALRFVSRRSAPARAEARYAVSVAALLLMFAVPATTFVFYAEAGSVLRVALRPVVQMVAPEGSGTAAPSLESLNGWTMWIAMAWSIGVAVSAARLALGWHVTRRMVRSATERVPEELKALFDDMRERLAFTRPVRLLLSARIDGPAAVGWLRPVVLMPLMAVTGLDANQLRVVLAHELAHIRRHDFMVNILQRCMESLLFYHPAVWWLSRRIRTEREHCCDDLAVQACGDPLIYAQTLVALERARMDAPALAMAATQNHLKGRILRLLGRRSENHDWRDAIGATVVILVLVTAGVWHSSTLQARTLPLAVSVSSETMTPIDPAERTIPAVPGPLEASTVKELLLAAVVFAQGPTPPSGQAVAIAGRLLRLDGTPAINVSVTAVAVRDGELSSVSSPPGVGGIWVSVGVPNQTWLFDFRQDGSKVTGTIQQAGTLPGPAQVLDGTVDGSTLIFRAQSPGGERTITFRGAIDGDEIAFMRTTGAPGGSSGLYGASAVSAFKVRRDNTLLDVAQTDSAGHYRLGGLPPGRYILAADLINTPTYFPGTASRTNATVVTLGTRPVDEFDFRMASQPYIKSATYPLDRQAPSIVTTQQSGRQTVTSGPTGTWVVSQGVGYAPWTFELRADGNTLTGTVSQNYSDFPGPSPIHDGGIYGNTIVFRVKPSSPGWPELHLATCPDRKCMNKIVTFAGQIEGEQIVFTRSIEMLTGGDPGGNGVFGGTGATQFAARRVAIPATPKQTDGSRAARGGVPAQEPAGTLSGWIINADGSPAIGVGVGALPVGDTRPPSTVGQDAVAGSRNRPFVSFVQTDGAGRYRLSDVPPGQYLVAAGQPSMGGIGGDIIYVREPRYFPDVSTEAAASAVRVTSGGTVEVRIRFAPSSSNSTGPAFRVTGRVIEMGLPQQRHIASLWLIPWPLPPAQRGPQQSRQGAVPSPDNSCPFSGPAMRSAINSPIGSDGSFEVRGVKPGEYLACVRAEFATSAQTIGPMKTVIVVDKDLSGIGLDGRIGGRRTVKY